MGYAVIFILALIEVGAFAFLMMKASSTRQVATRQGEEVLKEARTAREALVERHNKLRGEMLDISTLRTKVAELRGLQESLKAERGRLTITQAELETVESRLRELEEIERELEASGLETKQELNILAKKREDMSAKNSTLKDQLDQSMSQIESVMHEFESNTQAREQVDIIKSQILQTQQKIDIVMLHIEEGNEQYLIMKRRYDALDIEYAQLYEKFAESAGPSGGDDE